MVQKGPTPRQRELLIMSSRLPMGWAGLCSINPFPCGSEAFAKELFILSINLNEINYLFSNKSLCNNVLN